MYDKHIISQNNIEIEIAIVAILHASLLYSNDSTTDNYLT